MFTRRPKRKKEREEGATGAGHAHASNTMKAPVVITAGGVNNNSNAKRKERKPKKKPSLKVSIDEESGNPGNDSTPPSTHRCVTRLSQTYHVVYSQIFQPSEHTRRQFVHRSNQWCQ